MLDRVLMFQCGSDQMVSEVLSNSEILWISVFLLTDEEGQGKK